MESPMKTLSHKTPENSPVRIPAALRSLLTEVLLMPSFFMISQQSKLMI
jgi:hypothetical protein